MKNVVEVVQKQLDAYNNKNLDSWLDTYANNAIQFTTAGDVIATGHEQMAKNMAERFAEPDLFAKLLHRIVCENTVVDHEIITRNFPEGKGTIEMLCIYQVENGLIHKGQFKVFNKVLFSEGNN